MYHFIKLTHSSGRPLYINGEKVAAVHEDYRYDKDAPTIVELVGSDENYYHVKESVETVTDLLYGVMHE